MKTHSPAFDGPDFRGLIHQLFATGSGKGHVGWKLARSLDLLPGTSLEIDRHQEGKLGLSLQPVEQVGDIPWSAPVEHKTTHAVIPGESNPKQQPWIFLGDVITGDIGANHLADLFLQSFH